MIQQQKDQYQNEQDLLSQGSFSLQIPYSNSRHYPKRTITFKPFKQELEVVSKLPFNLDLDNILFISTLTRLETLKVDTSTSTSTCSTLARRISIQSDTSNTTTCSTEQIRRFSSVSTTSSFSSTSSFNNKRIPSPSSSSDIIMTSNNILDDPGHPCCDTLHSPTTVELPLYQPCVFYFIDYNSASLSVKTKSLFTCSTVWQFASCWRTVKNHTRVSRLLPNQNMCCFVQGIQPLWEDEANQGGGRLLIHVQQLDDVFEWLLCALIGANLDDCVVGVVAAKKQHRDRVELWMNDKMSQEQVPLLKENLCRLLDSSCHNEINASRYKKHSMEHT